MTQIIPKDKNNGALDYFRIIAALFIVAIHIGPLSTFNATADFLFTYCLGRIAVPFFLMTTGYFVLSSSVKHPKSLWKNLKKITILYVIATLIYFPINLYAGKIVWDLNIIAKDVLFDGTFYHLWYLPASIMGCLFVYYILKHWGFKVAIVIAVLCYIIGLFGDSYYNLVSSFAPVEGFYNVLFQISSYTRNGIFYAPIFLLIGVFIANHKFQLSRLILWVGLIVSTVCLLLEGYLVYTFDWQRHSSMYIFLLPCAFFLFLLLLSISKKQVPFLRKISTLVYILHPLCIIGVRGVAKVVGITKWLVDNSLLHFIAVCVSSLVASFVIAFLMNVFSKLYKKNTITPASINLSETESIVVDQTTAEHTIASNIARERGITRDSDITRADGTVKANHTALESRTARAWIELSSEYLVHNVAQLQSILPSGCTLMPAIKANAYGHGVRLIAGTLQYLGIEDYCVATLSEGICLRKAGISGQILILSYTHPSQFGAIVGYDLTQAVLDLPYATQLNSLGKTIKVHVGIDTGMHRLGERSEAFHNILEIFSYRNLYITGLFSHLCVAEDSTEEKREYTLMQIKQFKSVIDGLHENGFYNFKCHIQNSSGLLNYPDQNFDYVRTGIALYGVKSSSKDTTVTELDLKPVLSLKSRIGSMNTLYKGESLGYGLAYTADTDKMIGTVSIGYADGIPRSLSNKGYVLVKGQKAPIVGLVCMDQLMIDLTHITEASVGDTVVIIGESGEESILVSDLATSVDTISNEILSRLGTRLRRFMV